MCLALRDEVDFAKDGATQQDVDPGVEDLIPRGQPDARHHKELIAGEITSDRVCGGVDHGSEAKDLQTLNMVKNTMKIQTPKSGCICMLHCCVLHVMDILILFNYLCRINYQFCILVYIELLVVLLPLPRERGYFTAGVCLSFSIQ